MGKKTFRPAADGDARYPRLCELTRAKWREWGLVAVGSLVLAAGCRRAKGGSAVPVRTHQENPGVIQPMGGAPWPPRVDAASHSVVDAAAPDAAAPIPPLPLRGHSPPPRLQMPPPRPEGTTMGARLRDAPAPAKKRPHKKSE